MLKEAEDGTRRGIVPVIPYRAKTKDKPAYFPKLLYRARARVEQLIGKLSGSILSPCATKKHSRTLPPSSHWGRVHLDQIRSHDLVHRFHETTPITRFYRSCRSRCEQQVRR
jgi:hypothetical protein